MRRASLTAAACLAAAGLAAALPAAVSAQDLPPTIAAFAAERASACVAAGGAPTIGPAFATAVDLNGDGALDYILDLAGIECANAWSTFCGDAGCPLSVWLATPTGFRRDWEGVAQGWAFDPVGEEVAVAVTTDAAACPDGEAVGAACVQRLVFDAPADPVPDASPDEVEPETAEAPTEEAAPSGAEAAVQPTGVEGWTLRQTPDGAQVAVSDGPGAIGTLAAFCLSGQPWLAVRLAEPDAAGETAQLEFGFSGRDVSTVARREEGAGGALIVELAGSPLPGLLSGRDSSAQIALDGAAQGTLSLRGSTRTIRAALETCPAE